MTGRQARIASAFLVIAAVISFILAAAGYVVLYVFVSLIPDFTWSKAIAAAGAGFGTVFLLLGCAFLVFAIVVAVSSWAEITSP